MNNAVKPDDMIELPLSPLVPPKKLFTGRVRVQFAYRPRSNEHFNSFRGGDFINAGCLGGWHDNELKLNFQVLRSVFTPVQWDFHDELDWQNTLASPTSFPLEQISDIFAAVEDPLQSLLHAQQIETWLNELCTHLSSRIRRKHRGQKLMPDAIDEWLHTQTQWLTL